MSSYYYWFLFLFFFILAIILFLFADAYAGAAVLFFFFIVIIFYYTLSYPDVSKTVYVRKVNEDGSETILKRVEEVDNDIFPEKEVTTTIEKTTSKKGRNQKSVTVEQTSDFFRDTKVTVTPKKRKRKSKK